MQSACWFPLIFVNMMHCENSSWTRHLGPATFPPDIARAIALADPPDTMREGSWSNHDCITWMDDGSTLLAVVELSAFLVQEKVL